MLRRPTTVVAALCLALAGSAFALPQYGGKGKNPPANPPAGTPAPPAEAAPKPEAGGEAKYYERLDKDDREPLQANVGYMIPAPTASLQWLGGDAWKREDFRGKVTVIQATGGKAATRNALDKAQKALPEGVTLLVLHTPDGADRAKTSLGATPPFPVAVDASGEWCDALGVFKRPVNIVVDKTGAVRYVALTEAGLKAKLPALLAEEVDDSVLARERPAPAGGAADKKTPWPEFKTAVENATDQRGKAIPGFEVDQWMTARPDPGARLVAVDFWATWCGPCKAAIPHVNELNQKYGRDILFVGISDEAKGPFNAGLTKSKLKPANFSYALALDPKKRLYGFFGISAIPHMAIFSADGIVRWQGHPATLADEDLDKLVAANRANTPGAAPAGAAKPHTWAASNAQKSR